MKRILSVILSVLTVLCFCVTASAVETDGGESGEVIGILCGDVNCDNAVNAADYVLLKRAVLGTYSLPSMLLDIADCNGNDSLDASDYVLLKRSVSGSYSLPSVDKLYDQSLVSVVYDFFKVAYEESRFESAVFSTPFEELSPDLVARIVYHLNADEYSDSSTQEGEGMDTVITCVMPIEEVSAKAYSALGYSYDFTSVSPYSDDVNADIGTWYDAETESIIVRVKKYDNFLDKVHGNYESYRYTSYKIISANSISVTLSFSYAHETLCEVHEAYYFGEMILERQSDGTYRYIEYNAYDEPIRY